MVRDLTVIQANVACDQGDVIRTARDRSEQRIL